jgi:6-phosphogluconolactonase
MFAPAESGGIRGFHLDPQTGVLTAAAETRGVPHPFFLALAPSGKTLYSIWADSFAGPENGEVAAWRIADSTGRLTLLGRQSTGGTASCYVETDPSGRTLLVANYSSGDVASLPIDAAGAVLPIVSFFRHEGSSVNPDRQREPHAHAFVHVPAGPDAASRMAYVADLGTDEIRGYRLDAATARLEPAEQRTTKSAPGSGPRHLRFSKDSCVLYAINELGNTISVYGCGPGTGRLTELQTIPTLPEGTTQRTFAADLRLTPDGRFLYGTNRGHDSIAAYAVATDGRLSLVEIVPSLGKGPQNLAITPDGGLLMCANMPGNNVAVFRIDRRTGSLTSVGPPTEVTSPACIAILP